MVSSTCLLARNNVRAAFVSACTWALKALIKHGPQRFHASGPQWRST
jgi:hypothetical protein